MIRGLTRLAILYLLLALIHGGTPVLADTSATVGISVTIEDVGALQVGFDNLDGGYVFRNAAGSSNLAVNALGGETGTAVVRLGWSDTRSEATIAPFSIGLGLDSLVSTTNAPNDDGPATIASGHVFIIQIGETVLDYPLSLDEVRTIYSSPEAPVAGEGSLDVVLQLVVPASSFALTYQSAFSIHLSNGSAAP
jgi:hypothetical protein